MVEVILKLVIFSFLTFYKVLEHFFACSGFIYRGAADKFRPVVIQWA